MTKVGVLDYGCGNVFSIFNAVKEAGGECYLLNKNEDFRHVDKLILPGVGHYGVAINNIMSSGFDQSINDFVASGKNVLGICLGMHLLGAKSEEAEGAGLALLDFKVKRIVNGRINTGFYSIENIGIPNKNYYFNHGFYVGNTIYTTSKIKFARSELVISAEIVKDNIFGVQFHPEKSGLDGKSYLENFLL